MHQRRKKRDGSAARRESIVAARAGSGSPSPIGPPHRVVETVTSEDSMGRKTMTDLYVLDHLLPK